MPEVQGAPRWLLLIHQLPARPSNLRVRIWRRLQQVGAIVLRNSIYVLPNTSEAREDFEWIRAEITARGGQVSILSADAVDGYTDDELQVSFRNARTVEYDKLIELAGSVRKNMQKKQRQSRPALQREVARVRERFQAVRTSDYFGSPRAPAAQAALEHLEAELRRDSTRAVATDRLDPRAFRRRQWLTRPRPGIDRMASAWLIRRFIAPDAKFVFGGLPARGRQIPFDMPDVEFGHQGTNCTYETLLLRFGITDAAAVRVGQLVHDLDLKESRHGLPETTTVGRLVEGLRETASSDEALLADGIRLIEALHRAYKRDTGS